MSRREAIAEAAVDLVAERGAHALTHRRIDRRLDLPAGTTSNYARTRRDLVAMVIQRVADVAHLRERPGPAPADVAEAVEQLREAFEAAVRRGTDTRARMALTIDCLPDPELHELLTTKSPVRTKLLVEARTILSALDVPDPDARAVDFIAVMNGLLYDRLIGNGVRGTPADATAVLTAWLTGSGAGR
jgi:AcrR family transcriptional regulator